MEPKIRAELCKSCKGRGIYATGKACQNCKGVGIVGTDGVNEYFLGDDGRGNLRVVDIKSSPPSSQESLPASKMQKSHTRGLVRWLFVLVLIIIYAGFLGLHFLVLKNTQVFWLVSLITFGLIFLFVLYDVNFLKRIMDIIFGVIVKEPEDFLSAVRERKIED